MRRAVGVLKDTTVVNWNYTGGKMPVDRNTVLIHPRTTTQVRTGAGPSVPPIRIGSQKIEVPRRSILTQEVSNSEPLDAFIDIIPVKNRNPTPSWIKIIGSKNPPKKAPTSTRAVGRTSGVPPSYPKVQTLWILGCRLSTQRINSGPSSSPIP